jgi:hypothetical protein
VQGKLEVDLVLGDHEVAIEIKATQNANPRHAKGLKGFKPAFPSVKPKYQTTGIIVIDQK